VIQLTRSDKRAGSGVRRLDSFQGYRCSTTNDSVGVKSLRALKLPHRCLGISAEVAIVIGTQQVQVGKHALQAADIGAIVTEPERSSSVPVRWQSSCMSVVVAQGPEHDDVELVYAGTQFGETTADRPYLDRCLVGRGHLSDELVELLPNCGVLGEQLSFQLEERLPRSRCRSARGFG
jgi:hypothetical protein